MVLRVAAGPHIRRQTNQVEIQEQTPAAAAVVVLTTTVIIMVVMVVREL